MFVHPVGGNLWSFQLYVIVTYTEDTILTMMYRISLTVLV